MSAAAIWIWFCALLSCAGWALSATHQLNAAGYAIVLAILFFVLVAWRKIRCPRIVPVIKWRKIYRRFRKPFPLAFLILATMAFLGGAIYAPSNYDALAYRIPRVLHWLAAGQWHWIHTIFPRLNTRGCGIEWVSAPFLALLKTDRPLFLINIVSFLVLPSLIFSVFTRLGVRARVAWHWMWIAPTGYCFLLQAGSIGNDLFGAPFALAAIDFALRARKSKPPHDFLMSILAAASLTGVKASNLPLLLPWLIAIAPSLRLVKLWPLRTLAFCGVAFFVSFLPLAILNARNCGDWSGLKPEGIGSHQKVMLLTSTEATLVIMQNFTPPLFPLTKLWHDNLESFLPTGIRDTLDRTLDTGSAIAAFNVPELQIEDNAGLGAGVSGLLLVSSIASYFQNRRRRLPREPSIWQTSIQIAPFISLLAVIANSNVANISRVLAPYYLLLVPLFLVQPGYDRLLKYRWWRGLAYAVFAAAAILLILSSPRPLFPVRLLLDKIDNHTGEHPSLARVKEVYSVYRNRWDAFAPARQALPPEIDVVGLITYDDPETSLWRPFGTRRTEHIRPEDSADDLKARGIKYALIKEEGFDHWFGCSLDEWIKRMNAEVVEVIPLNLRASVGPRDWRLVKLAN